MFCIVTRRYLKRQWVARPDEQWGETPCAFVTLKQGLADITESEVIDSVVSIWPALKRRKQCSSDLCQKPAPVRCRNSNYVKEHYH